MKLRKTEIKRMRGKIAQYKNRIQRKKESGKILRQVEKDEKRKERMSLAPDFL